MSQFEYIGDRAILYKGRICPLLEHDGWEVVNAMNRVDEEEARESERLKEKLKAELISEYTKRANEEGDS